MIWNVVISRRRKMCRREKSFKHGTKPWPKFGLQIQVHCMYNNAHTGTTTQFNFTIASVYRYTWKLTPHFECDEIHWRRLFLHEHVSAHSFHGVYIARVDLGSVLTSSIHRENQVQVQGSCKNASFFAVNLHVMKVLNFSRSFYDLF